MKKFIDAKHREGGCVLRSGKYLLMCANIYCCVQIFIVVRKYSLMQSTGRRVVYLCICFCAFVYFDVQDQMVNVCKYSLMQSRLANIY